MGPGPCGSHHRRLKTRLTVRMTPRRRTKGSQVFTKAPMLMEREGSMGGKSPVSGRVGRHTALPQTQTGPLPPRKLLELPPSPPNSVN